MSVWAAATGVSAPADASRIDLWAIPFTADDPERQERARSLLTDQERARADRLIRSADGARFTLWRATLRVILSQYLGHATPQDLPLAQEHRGKPCLPPALRALSFNLTHSHELAVLAVCGQPDLLLGVDLEHTQARAHLEQIAKHAFSPAERHALSAWHDDPAGYRAAFFRVWTRKEAYLKAIGMGLNIPLDSFSISAATSAQAVPLLEATHDDAFAPHRWHIQTLTPAPRPDYTLSLAYADSPALSIKTHLCALPL